MPYTVPTFDEIRAAYLRDVQNVRPDAAVYADSDAFVRASATSSAVDGLYHYQSWIARQVLPDTADPENIEYHAALRGLAKKAATAAEGVAVLLAAGDVPPFPAGLSLVHKETGDLFRTTAGCAKAALQGETITLPVIAARKGAMPQYENEPVTLQTPPQGVAGQAAITMHGGTEEETHAELLARLLFYMRNPPGGGTKTDYELWAREVPGIKHAVCLPGRRGLGTVDVLAWGENGLAAPDVIAAAQAHVDEKRPVACKDCLVLSPTLFPVDITARLCVKNGTLPQFQAPAELALERLFSGIGPGQAVSYAAIVAALVGVKDVSDADVTEPRASLAPGAIVWPRFGSLCLKGW